MERLQRCKDSTGWMAGPGPPSGYLGFTSTELDDSVLVAVKLMSEYLAQSTGVQLKHMEVFLRLLNALDFGLACVKIHEYSDARMVSVPKSVFRPGMMIDTAHLTILVKTLVDDMPIMRPRINAAFQALLQASLRITPEDEGPRQQLLDRLGLYGKEEAYDSAIVRYKLGYNPDIKADGKSKAVPYRYQPLPRRQIRILSLQPGSPVEPDSLVCSISVVDLRKQSVFETFEAVSYAWGEPSLCHTLYCEGGTGCLQITERLHGILQELGPKSHIQQPKRLWIDAICIDQQNDVERGHQVGMMYKIYRRASTVQVFLTDASLWHSSEWFHRSWGMCSVPLLPTYTET